VVHVESPDQVDIDEFRPVLGSSVKERNEEVPAGVVDQHVDLAQFGDYALYRCVNRRSFRDVTGNSERLGPVCGQNVSHILSRARSSIEDSHSRPLSSELSTKRAANSAATTGYYNGLTVESSHEVLLQI
jgi:hypothetical protein